MGTPKAPRTGKSTVADFGFEGQRREGTAAASTGAVTASPNAASISAARKADGSPSSYVQRNAWVKLQGTGRGADPLPVVGRQGPLVGPVHDDVRCVIAAHRNRSSSAWVGGSAARPRSQDFRIPGGRAGEIGHGSGAHAKSSPAYPVGPPQLRFRRVLLSANAFRTCPSVSAARAASIAGTSHSACSGKPPSVSATRGPSPSP